MRWNIWMPSAARALRLTPIHPHLDVGQEFRRVLDFVDNDGNLEALQEECWLLDGKLA